MSFGNSERGDQHSTNRSKVSFADKNRQSDQLEMDSKGFSSDPESDNQVLSKKLKKKISKPSANLEPRNKILDSDSLGAKNSPNLSLRLNKKPSSKTMKIKDS